MKFYDRQIETETLQRIEALSHESSQMTVITGRRRIGKTTLIKHACHDIGMIYFFVARKSETLLCQELCGTIRDMLGEDLGDFTSMSRLFAAIMQMAGEKKVYYVNVAEAIKDENGCLPADVGADGMHFGPSTYNLWLDYLRDHYAE